jgi:hypothetical protein
MTHEKVAKHGTGTTDQPCFYFIKEGSVISRGFRCAYKAVWDIQSTGISLRTTGQKEPRYRTDSGTIQGIYGKIGTKPYQTYKGNRIIDGVIDQYSSKNGTGGVFIKTSAWRKKREALNSPGLMTGLVSKSSPRLTVSLSLIQHLTIS